MSLLCTPNQGVGPLVVPAEMMAQMDDACHERYHGAYIGYYRGLRLTTTIKVGAGEISLRFLEGDGRAGWYICQLGGNGIIPRIWVRPRLAIMMHSVGRAVTQKWVSILYKAVGAAISWHVDVSEAAQFSETKLIAIGPVWVLAWGSMRKVSRCVCLPYGTVGRRTKQAKPRRTKRLANGDMHPGSGRFGPN
jgi:hypothetical protein